VTASHQFLKRPQDASAVWVEDLREDSFQACVKETKIFDGLHKNIKVVSTLQFLLYFSAKHILLKHCLPNEEQSNIIYLTSKSLQGGLKERYF